MPAHSYEIVPATLEHVAAVAAWPRQPDVDEVYAASGMPFAKALEQSYRLSTHAWAGLIDGEVACVFGVSPLCLATGDGVPWLLGTPLIERHAFGFLRRSRWYIRTMMGMYNRLENYVDVRNNRSIAWLRWLGFEMDDPAPYGKFRMPFMRFEMRF